VSSVSHDLFRKSGRQRTDEEKGGNDFQSALTYPHSSLLLEGYRSAQP
jgi:hypothetical protein